MWRSILTAIPKVSGTLECDKHRPISLIGQITKILLKLIINGIRKRLREIYHRYYMDLCEEKEQELPYSFYG